MPGWIVNCFCDRMPSSLLQSSGLKWFHCMFENEEYVFHVNGDQSIVKALDTLWESWNGAIAVINQGTKRLIKSSDIHLIE